MELFLVTASKGLTDNFSPRVIELYAACLGLQLTKNGGYSHVIFEMDALTVVFCLSSSDDFWVVDGILVEVAKSYFSSFYYF